MTTTVPNYQSAAEVLVVLAAVLPSSDPRRLEFEGLSTADQDAFAAAATADLDACLWIGADAESGQLTRFPRRWERGRVLKGSDCTPGSYVDPDPSPPADPTVANIPANLRLAHAVQAAHRAHQAAGLSPNVHLEEAASKGVTSQSGGGLSQTVDLKRATSSWAALCREAQKWMSPYRRAGGAMV